MLSVGVEVLDPVEACLQTGLDLAMHDETRQEAGHILIQVVHKDALVRLDLLQEHADDADELKPKQ